MFYIKNLNVFLIKMKLIYLLILINCILLTSCTNEQEGIMTIQDAWLREAPPNASAMAGYLTIHNNTTQDKMLTFAKSKHFNAIEFHRTTFEDDIAKMRRHDELSIPAGQSREFKPGDFHLMLFGPKEALKSGDEVVVTLCILDKENLEEIDINMYVKKP